MTLLYLDWGFLKGSNEILAVLANKNTKGWFNILNVIWVESKQIYFSSKMGDYLDLVNVQYLS